MTPDHIIISQQSFAWLVANRAPGFEAAIRAVAEVTPRGLKIPVLDYRRIGRAHYVIRRGPPPTAPKPRGLGDLVATLAEPIAAASDKLLGTHLVGCQSCAERRAALNRLIPKL